MRLIVLTLSILPIILIAPLGIQAQTVPAV